jgi:hypothetical protein
MSSPENFRDIWPFGECICLQVTEIRIQRPLKQNSFVSSDSRIDEERFQSTNKTFHVELIWSEAPGPKDYFFSKITRTALRPISFYSVGTGGSYSGNGLNGRGVNLTTNPNLYIFLYNTYLKNRHMFPRSISQHYFRALRKIWILYLPPHKFLLPPCRSYCLWEIKSMASLNALMFI